LPLPAVVAERLEAEAAARLPAEYGCPGFALGGLLEQPPVSDADIDRMLASGLPHLPVRAAMLACASCTRRPVFPYTDTGYPVTTMPVPVFCDALGLGHTARAARFLRLSAAQLAAHDALPPSLRGARPVSFLPLDGAAAPLVAVALYPGFLSRAGVGRSHGDNGVSSLEVEPSKPLPTPMEQPPPFESAQTGPRALAL